MTDFYKTDITKLTNAEIGRVARSWPGYLVARLHKLLRWPISPAIGFLRSERLDILDFDELSRPARRAFRQTFDECEDCGFRLEFCYTIGIIGPAEGYAAALLSADRPVWAAPVFTRVHPKAGPAVKSGCALVSLRADGSAVSTTNLAREFDPPPWVAARHERGLDV